MKLAEKKKTFEALDWLVQIVTPIPTGASRWPDNTATAAILKAPLAACKKAQ